MININTQQGEIKNLKFRKEGQGEDANVALDISLSLTCEGKGILDTILGADSADSFWRPGGADVRFPYLAKCESIAKVRYCSVNIAGLTLENCVLSKTTFIPKPNGFIDLTANCSANDLSEHDLAAVKNLLRVPCSIAISGGDLVDAMNADDDDQTDMLEDEE